MNKLAIAAVATAALGAAATSHDYAGINMRFLGRLFPLGANAMHVSFAKLARAATLLAAGILASVSSG